MFTVAEGPRGRTLLVKGPWTPDADRALWTGDIDLLVLNEAWGFQERDLEFLRGWPLKKLDVLARTLTDLSPVLRLQDTLEELSVEASRRAHLDVGALSRLRVLHADWPAVGRTLRPCDHLEELFVSGATEDALHALGAQPHLRSLRMRNSSLQDLRGLDQFPGLRHLELSGCRRITSLEALQDAHLLVELNLEACRSVTELDGISACPGLTYLNISDMGPVVSVGPLDALDDLRDLYAHSSTLVLDGDLGPVARRPRLVEFRMQDRRTYRPSVKHIQSTLGSGAG